jgi:hypothetical protein
MAFVFFTPIATTPVTNIVPTNTSQNVVLGTGTTGVQITNTGSATAYVLNAATVSFATGIPVPAGTTMYLGALPATGISVIGLGSALTIIAGS